MNLGQSIRRWGYDLRTNYRLRGKRLSMEDVTYQREARDLDGICLDRCLQANTATIDPRLVAQQSP